MVVVGSVVADKTDVGVSGNTLPMSLEGLSWVGATGDTVKG